MMSVEDATLVREILNKMDTEDFTHMRVVKELSLAGFRRVTETK